MGTLPKIKTLDQLLKIIHTGPGYGGYAEMFRQVDFGAEELKDYIKWSDEKYQKVLIDGDDESYQLYLMCWEEGQETPIHDHSGAQSWIYVIEGSLKEVIYSYDEHAKRLWYQRDEVIRERDVRYFNDCIGIHKIQNVYKGRTISFHYYSDPDDHVHVFDPETGERSDYKIH